MDKAPHPPLAGVTGNAFRVTPGTSSTPPCGYHPEGEGYRVWGVWVPHASRARPRGAAPDPASASALDPTRGCHPLDPGPRLTPTPRAGSELPRLMPAHPPPSWRSFAP